MPEYNVKPSNISVGKIIKWVLLGLAVIVAISSFNGLIGHNDNQNWQIVQSLRGNLEVVHSGGYYFKNFGNVWTYPKYVQLDYTQERTKDYPDDESISVTFNDGGNAAMSTIMRVGLPTNDAQCISFHQQLPDKNGDHYELRKAIKAHLTNCLKSTGPLMSASEHQTARKAEYAQIVQEQMRLGLYEMKRVERVLKDQFDAKGNPITVFATEIITDPKGVPVVSQHSPLTELGIEIKQLSVTGTDYDEQTKKQFQVKKEAFLAGETSKAQREKEVQQRLMVVEKGLREKAEIEAESNKTLAAATIQANQQKLVAETNATQEKIVAETEAAKKVAVALQTKVTAETAAAQEKAVAELQASQRLEVAKLDRMAAEQNAAKQVALAEAQKKSLELAGAISEKDRVLAQISADRDVQVAAQLAKIAVPSVVIGGQGTTGGTSDNGQGITSQLINMQLLKSMNIVK
jgi:hypothetical protein